MGIIIIIMAFLFSIICHRLLILDPEHHCISCRLSSVVLLALLIVKAIVPRIDIIALSFGLRWLTMVHGTCTAEQLVLFSALFDGLCSVLCVPVY